MLIPPSTEILFIQEPNTTVELRIYDSSYLPTQPQSDDETTEEEQPDPIYGFAVAISDMTSGSTPSILAVTADAPGSQIDLTSLGGSVLHPFDVSQMHGPTEAIEFPEYRQKLKRSQVLVIRPKYHQRR